MPELGSKGREWVRTPGVGRDGVVRDCELITHSKIHRWHLVAKGAYVKIPSQTSLVKHLLDTQVHISTFTLYLFNSHVNSKVGS